MIKKNDLTIVSKVRFCDSIFSKATGLRFRWIKDDEAYVFRFEKPQKVLMDMLFVFYPIDVVFLDKDFRIVEVKERFMPFSFYSSKKDANYIIELKNCSVKKFELFIGDKLEIN